METNVKKETLQAAILTLHKAIEHYDKAQTLPYQPKVYQPLFNNQQELIEVTRDSMIKRFKYCVTGLLNCCKTYLKNSGEITLESKSPRGVFKALCATRTISEHDAELALEMVDARNATSHRYKEEQAELLASKIRGFYELITKITSRV